MRRALSSTALVGLWIWGCGSSSEEKLRAAELAGSCAINSDCEYPLVCAFARCHKPCDEDRDCLDGMRCMHGPIEGTLVCQLEEEVACETDRDCPADKAASQVCGIDNECRDPCKSDDDCTPTQLCAKSGECASTYLDEVDGEGNIVKQNTGTGGSGSGGSGNTGGSQASGGESGDTGSGGRGGTGAAGSGGSGAVTQGDGGSRSSEAGAGGEAGDGGSSSGTGGAVGTGGDQGGRGSGGSAGQGGTLGGAGVGGTLGGGGAGVGGDAGSSASAGAPAAGDGGTTGAAGGLAGSAGMGGSGGEILTETDDGVELVDNDARESAVVAPLPSKATIYVNSYYDEDWFSVTPPNDGLTHIISLKIEQDSGANSAFRAFTAEDYVAIEQELTAATGSTDYAYLTVGPGATMLFRFRRKTGSVTAGLAHVSFDVETENDAHEPNNAKEDATPIVLGESYSGIACNPWVSNLNRPYQDWYAIDLALGPTTFTFTAVPSQGRVGVSRVSPSGTTTSVGANTTGTIGPESPFNVTEAGTWYLVLEPYSGISAYSGGAKPTYLNTPYSFTVTQP